MPTERRPIAIPGEIRREQKLRRLGTRQPQCAECTEVDPAALTGTAPDIRCYECLGVSGGRGWTEDHHLGGQHNDPATASLPGNDHRFLNDAQLDWPEETLRNPDGSPLLKIAALLRGFLDVLWLIIERAVGWIPTALESLDATLRQAHGPRWWESLGWDGGRP